MVIEMYKTGFTHPGDVPFEDLSVGGTSVTASNSAQRTDTVRGTVSGRQKKRTGFRGLFNTKQVAAVIFFSATVAR